MARNKYYFRDADLDAWRSLLSAYQGIEDFDRAFVDLTGNSALAEVNWAEHGPGIQKNTRTTKNSRGIESRADARAIMGPMKSTLITSTSGGTYYRALYMEMKAVGLITGLNPRFLPELQVDPPTFVNDKDKDRFKRSKLLAWDQSLDAGKDPVPIWAGENPIAGRGLVLVTPRGFRVLDPRHGLYFISPFSLYYLVRRGAMAGEDNPFTKLAIELYNLLGMTAFFGPPSTGKAAGPLRATKILESGVVTKELIINAQLNGEGNTRASIDDFFKKATFNAPDGPDIIKDDWPGDFSATVQEVFKPSFSPAPGLSGGPSHLVLIRPKESDPKMALKGTIAYNPESDRAIKDFLMGVDGGSGRFGMWKDFYDPDSRPWKIDTLIKEIIKLPESEGGLGLTEDNKKERRKKRFKQILDFLNSKTVDEQVSLGNAQQAQAHPTAANFLPGPRNLTPIDLQCFLLEQVRAIADQHIPDYKNIIRLNSEGNPGIVKNKITAPLGKNEAQALLSICPDVQALLVPYLKISRVTYGADGQATGKELELDIPNFVKKEEIDDILGKGRLSGAGIKSFSWSLDGVQPAEVDNNISATLELYFQTVSDFFNNADQAGKKGRASYLDLVISSASTNSDDEDDSSAKCNAELTRRYDGENYRIKVVAGWATPDENTLAALGSMPPQKYKNLLAAIKKSKIILFLQQIRHDFKFNQDGSLNLTVEYQASLSGMATSPRADILGPSQTESQKRIEYTEEHVEKLKTKYGSEPEPTEKVKIKEAVKEVKKARGEDRMKKYKRLLSRLFKSGKIYSLSVHPDELLLPPYDELTPEERAARAKRRGATRPEIWQSPADDNIAILDAIAAGETRAPDKDDDTALSEFVSNKFSVDLQKEYDDLPGSTDKVWVSFFYLGDLIDMVLEQIKTNHDRSNIPFKFFISDVEMIDPLSALKIKNLDELLKCKQNLRNATFLDALVEVNPTEFTKANGISQLMNIGDIPIGLDAFQVWFKNYVIKRNRDKYFFLHFVKDICGDLITKALASKRFGPDVSFTQRFDAQPISFKRNANLQPNAIIRAGVSEGGYSLAQSVRQLTSTTSPTNSDLGLVLLSTDSKPYGLEGEKSYGADLDKGVYHHYLGSACGLVKTINFNREDQPFLRETKIQKVGALGAEQLRELYSAEMELYGNTLYKNGNYVYINPKLFGATDRQLTLLGLHGYYLITKVSSTVTESSFNVSIKALHEGMEFSGDQLMLPESYDNLVADVGPPLGTPLPDSTIGRGPDSTSASTTKLIKDLKAADDPMATAYELTELHRLGLISDDRFGWEMRNYGHLQMLNENAISHAEYAEFLKTDPYGAGSETGWSALPSLP